MTGRRFRAPIVLLATTGLLPGCTLLSSGIAVSPPGIHRYSFRECLYENGFFAETALVGHSRQNYDLRHAGGGGGQ